MGKEIKKILEKFSKSEISKPEGIKEEHKTDNGLQLWLF